ncbi:MAG: ABA4-like family protein [Pseudomonadota bacterium]
MTDTGNSIHPTLHTMYKWQVMPIRIGWLCLLIPFFSLTNYIVGSAVVVTCLGYLYLLAFGRKYDQSHRQPSYKDFFSLDGVVSMFKNPRVTLTGWLHFLAFDLLIGLYIVNDAQGHDIAHWFLLPILVITLMAGPFGLLLYLLLRLFYTQDVGLFFSILG